MGLFKKEIKKIEKKVGKDIKDAEDWMIARRKFFVKLSIVIVLVTALIISSHLYLK